MIVLPTFDEVRSDRFAFAEATRLIHVNTNPFNAKTLIQFHDREAIVGAARVHVGPPDPDRVARRDGQAGDGGGLAHLAIAAIPVSGHVLGNGAVRAGRRKVERSKVRVRAGADRRGACAVGEREPVCSGGSAAPHFAVEADGQRS